MKYRKLGKTNLEVSLVGFGASPLGAEFGPIDPAEGQRAVDAAIDYGINYFDVAPYYGRTLAETRLGEFLAGKRNQVVLATKVGRYDIGGFDFSAERVTASVDESLRRLRTDWIDIIQIHDIEYGDREQIIHETIPALQRLKQTGKVRFVGVTGYPLQQFVDIITHSDVDTILSYCRYDLLDTSLAEILTPIAKSEGVGLINASPLHMRALTNKGAPDWHPAPKRVLAASEQAAAFCRDQGVNLADVAMQFALASADVASTLVGMSKVRHVEMNVRATDMALPPELLLEVQRILEPVKNVIWKEGRPENDDPGAVEKQS